MSPTRIDGLPPVMAWASGVWIWAMSHCRPDRLSLSVAGAFGRSPVGGPAALSSTPSTSLVAKPAVAETPSTRASLRAAARNVVDVEETTATPICG